MRLFGSRRAPDGSLARDNFVRWFGSSKVVEADGMPRPVFHGTARLPSQEPFTIFEQRPSRRFPQLLPRPESRAGFYFYPNWHQAEAAANAICGPEKVPVVLEVYLSLRNPYVSKPHEFAFYASIKDIDRLRAAGHDGIIAMEQSGGNADLTVFQYIAFTPYQIKSANDNVGLFSPTSSCSLDLSRS